MRASQKPRGDNRPDVCPLGIHDRMTLEASKRALKAFHRHGPESLQFIKAKRSRWLRGRPDSRVMKFLAGLLGRAVASAV